MLHLPLRRTLALASLVAFIALPAAVRANGTTIVPVSPTPDDAIVSNAPTIVVDVVSGDSASLDPHSVQFVLDGHDLSNRISVSGVELTYAAHDLAEGPHRVQVVVDRGAQGRATYEWAFRVDPNAKPGTTTNESDETAPISGALPALIGYGSGYGSDYSAGGSPDGTLQTMGPSPYYWGDSIPFMFYGPPGGYGYLTYGGIPGAYDLFPYGPGAYYGFVPVPVGYAFVNPPVVVHFWHHNTPIIIHLHRPPIIVHKRDPAPAARRVAIERELHVVPPAVPTQLRPLVITTIPRSGSPYLSAPHVYYSVPGSSSLAHPRYAAPAPAVRAAPRPMMREVQPRAASGRRG